MKMVGQTVKARKWAQARRFLVRLLQVMSMAGFDPIRLVRFLAGLPRYGRDLWMFREMTKDSGERFGPMTVFPCLHESAEDGGTARGHYFHQDLLIARKIFERNPRRHIDVGSRVDGFVAHVASFREIQVLDIRPIVSYVKNISFLSWDATGSVPADLRGTSDSVSCLHALEHFGLGRYGDPLDPQGFVRGLATLTDLLEADGTLYLSVPIGPGRIEFNGGRVFSVRRLLDLVEQSYHVRSFSMVDDVGDLHENVRLDDAAVASDCGVWYGCAILDLQKCSK